MWGSLKSDFTEFVTTVTTDATDALASIDSKLEDGEEGAEAASMIDPDTGIVIEAPAVTKAEMKNFLHCYPPVFLDELEEENMDFDLDQKTEVISKLLEDHHETLAATFEGLVDQVEYKEFWKRYFHRLDDDRLETTYREYNDQHQKELSEVKSDGRSALSSVTTFLGGAVKRLVDDDVAQGGADVAPSPFHTVSQTSGSAMNFFAGGRPPFVLNTAVSEDDDSPQQQDDEDEEEELGWDDDDDDDDFDDEEIDDDGAGSDDDPNMNHDKGTEQIEFKDAEKERLQTELDQALAEREMLHKTVEMQTDEIAKWKKLAEGDETQQMEALKMLLFERDSELAALRARLEESMEELKEGTSSPTAIRISSEEFDRLKSDLQYRENEVAKLQREVSILKQGRSEEQSKLQKNIETLTADVQSSKSAFESAACEKVDMQAQIDSLKQTLAQVESEKLSLCQMQAPSGDDTEAKLSLAQQELSQAHVAMESLKVESSKLQLELSSTRASLDVTTNDLEATRNALEEEVAEMSQAKSALEERMQAVLAAKDEALRAQQTTFDSKLKELQELEVSLTDKEANLEAQGSELASAVSENQVLQERIRDMASQLQQMKIVLVDREAEMEQAKATTQHSATGPSSSDVNVASTELETGEAEAPAVEPSVLELPGDEPNDDGDDGWGDDW